jgi:Fe-S-cluster containining protein
MNSKDVCKSCFDSGRGCCKKVRIPIHKDEKAAEIFLQVWRDEGIPEDDLTDDVTRNSWVYDSNDKSCYFLDLETGECKIHDNKPIICKVYPLKWGKDDSTLFMIFCPLTHVIPLQEIKSWVNPYLDKIKDITKYEDEGNLKQREITFINLTVEMENNEVIKEIYSIKE